MYESPRVLIGPLYTFKGGGGGGGGGGSVGPLLGQSRKLMTCLVTMDVEYFTNEPKDLPAYLKS